MFPVLVRISITMLSAKTLGNLYSRRLYKPALKLSSKSIQNGLQSIAERKLVLSG